MVKSTGRRVKTGFKFANVKSSCAAGIVRRVKKNVAGATDLDKGIEGVRKNGNHTWPSKLAPAQMDRCSLMSATSRGGKIAEDQEKL
mmetsp:Transcript_85960/g.179735  ORF Transcript_85960/g.179735 Transcript_85960/m.179735 type:complete len:87 (+) Transcript_85960:2420-2680(+)